MGNQSPWVGRGYAHLAVPRPHLDEEYLHTLDRAVLEDHGWRPVDATTPVLFRRWRHERGGTLLAVVVGWYPLLLSVGTDGRMKGRVRRAKDRVVDAAVRAGGRRIADRELPRAVAQGQDRWRQAVQARAAAEQQQALTERRRCGHCGVWSAAEVVHCAACGRRFSGQDDTERDEAGRSARETIVKAGDELERLGRGEGLFADWPTPTAERR